VGFLFLRKKMKLAVIGKVLSTKLIDGADNIVSAEIVCGDAGKWQAVVSKGVCAGGLCAVFLQDAILPPDERWAFMERHNWRVKMARFKGAPSECVALPIGDIVGSVGDDLTALLGITKFEKKVAAGMTGEILGDFPSFLPKTDEVNFQRVDFAELMAGEGFYCTEKADGTSCTAWVDEAGLHVASRNFELREFSGEQAQTPRATNIYWAAARKYKLESMPTNTAIQFEVVGDKVQGNPMGVKDVEGRLFSVLKKSDGRWLNVDFDNFPKNLMPLAKPVKIEQRAYSADELRKLAEIKYDNGRHGEGVVIRAKNQNWSFKVINLLYKD
jgi:RNA ligase (TIGR02306 family)